MSIDHMGFGSRAGMSAEEIKADDVQLERARAAVDRRREAILVKGLDANYREISENVVLDGDDEVIDE